MEQLANEGWRGLRKRCLSGTEDKRSFPISLSFPKKKKRYIKWNWEVQNKYFFAWWMQCGSCCNKTLVLRICRKVVGCILRRKIYKAYFSQYLARGNLELQVVVGSGNVLGDAAAQFSSLGIGHWPPSQTRYWLGDAISRGVASLWCLILFNCILLFLYLSVPATPSCLRCS